MTDRTSVDRPAPVHEGLRVAIDAGQSSVRVRLHEPGGVRELVFAGIHNDRPAIDQVAQLLAQHDDFGARTIAVGLTGFEGDQRDAAGLLGTRPALHRVAVAHDSITAYLGANGTTPGVVAAIGTGVVTLGVGDRGIARVDGWGVLLGDAGSGYWIGRAGLDAALRAHDGRGRPTLLSAAAVEEFGPIGNLPLTVQADPHRNPRIAAFARRVTAVAESDVVAGGILDLAATELAVSIATAARRAGVLAPRISATGQVAQAPELRTRLARRLESVMPDAGGLAPAMGTPLDGVDRLFELSDRHPLADAVAVARR